MFHLHDKTRRKLAIAGFLLLCLLPTCAVAGWCLWRNMPWETQLAAERLQQQLGWKVKLERLKHPQPGTDVYENLELIDPETGNPIFSCRSVSFGISPIPVQGQSKPMLVFTFDQPEIEAASIPLIHQLLERVMQEQVAPGTDFFFKAAQMKICRGESMQTYSSIEAGVVHDAKQVNAAFRFSFANSEKNASITLGLTRDRSVFPLQNQFGADAEESEVPPELLALMGGTKIK